MANLHLPLNIIGKFLGTEEDTKNLKYILQDLDSTQNIDILFDREKLEQLYLELNPQQFLKKQFREIILDSNYGTKMFYRFLESIGISKEAANKIQKQKLISHAANFHWGPNNDTEAFLNAFGLDKSSIPIESVEEQNSEKFPMPHNPYSGLFDYQSSIFFDALKLLKIQNKRFIIQLPTGAGKTKVAMEIVIEFMNSNEDSTVVWLADRKELCMQAIDAFIGIWQHRGRKTITLNRSWDKYQLMPPGNGTNLVVSTIGKILEFRRSSSKKNILKSDLIIFDEAHHAAAPEYHHAILFLSKPGTRVIGLTATPGRSLRDKDENKKLANMFDDDILQITVEERHTGVIEYLQKRGILSKAKKMPPINVIKLNQMFTKDELKSIAKDSDYSPKILKKLGKSHLRNIEIAKKLVEIGKQGKQVLYFGTDVSQSKLMFAVAKYFGFTATHIEADTPKEFRKDVIKKFKNKKIQFLFNYDVLSTGFDAPSVDVVFLARPTKSPILLLQMIGRGMRGPAIGGTETFDLYYVNDGILEQFVNLDELFELFDEYYV